MKSCEEWKDVLKNEATIFLKKRLNQILEHIRFLESIYMYDGENHYFSERFGDAANKERQDLCQLSSAMHGLLKERQEETPY